MKLLKPSWVHHDDKPIFSIDVHQECLKFATGGHGMDSGRVVIWNLLPVLSEKAEMDSSVPKVLCQMDQHLACVNCVRWSQNGQLLASCSDDKLVMIWRKSQGSSGVFGTGGMKKNVEPWKCIFTLRGHAGDVLDLAWSPHDRYLASCSIDNTIIIWDALSFPTLTKTLKGHTGLVKGVSWDPVGKFLASQSDDRSIKIWKTSDWTCSSVIKEPFEECGGTTHILRLSWSPDGQYLVSAHAMNGGGPTAQIIEREGWKCDKDFVGHRKAVTCVRFHNSILKRQSKPNKNSGKPQQYCCLAVGSRDRSLSVWMTALQRPLVVIHDLFDDSILDLSWGPKKCILLACSGDGTVACLQFADEELGTPLSEVEKNAIFHRIYGKNSTLENGMAGPTNNAIIENPELLLCSQDKIKPPTLPGICTLSDCNNVNTINTTREIDEGQNSTKAIGKQLESRTPDGRRRITPMFIPPNQDLSDSSSKTCTIISKSTTSDFAAIGVNGLDTTKMKIIDESKLDARLLMMPNRETPIPFDDTVLKSFPLEITNNPPRKPVGPTVINNLAYQASTVGPKLNITPNTKCEFYKCVLEYRVCVQNGNMQTTNGMLARVIAYSLALNEILWEVFVGSPVINFNYCVKYIMLCSLDGSLRLLRMQSGMVVWPSITLNSGAIQCAFCPNNELVGVITECGILRVWHIEKRRTIVATKCSEIFNQYGSVLQFIITSKGIPVISFSNGNTYSFSESLQSWVILNCNMDPILNHGFRTTLPRELKKNYKIYPLLTAQASTFTHISLINPLEAETENWQIKSKTMFIENQIKLSEAMDSPEEVKYWYHMLIFHLAVNSTEERLRFVLDNLLDEDNESRKILALVKEDLLESVLETLKPHVRWQRIYTEYQELHKFCKSERNAKIFCSESNLYSKQKLFHKNDSDDQSEHYKHGNSTKSEVNPIEDITKVQSMDLT